MGHCGDLSVYSYEPEKRTFQSLRFKTMSSNYTWLLLFHTLSMCKKPTKNGGLSVCLCVASTVGFNDMFTVKST